MNKKLLLEIERTREIMGLNPLIMEGLNLLLTESVDIGKLWEKLFERAAETEVEGAISRNSRIFEIGTEKLEDKIASRGTKPTQEVVEEFLQKVARQDTEKYLEMISKLADELPNFAEQLATTIGENKILFQGNEVAIYDVLDKWLELNTGPGSINKFKEVCEKLSNSLNIPKSTMNDLRDAALKNRVGSSLNDSYVIDNIADHFKQRGTTNLERATEETLEKLLQSITEEDLDRFTEEIINSNEIFSDAMITPGGSLNVNAPTLIDYCLNRAPKNIRKYFRTKYKLSVKNLDIPIPFTSVENLPLVEKELKLLRGTLGKIKPGKPTEEIFEELNKHVKSKITPGMWEQAWDKLGCYGESYSKQEWLKAALSFGKYVKDMKTSEGRKAWCFIAQGFVVTFALKLLVVDLGLNIPGGLVKLLKYWGNLMDELKTETVKEIKGTLTAEDTKEIEAFYEQHPESREEGNNRFNPDHNDYFEVKVNQTVNTIDGEQTILSDWQVVKFENGEYKLEDAKTWWEKQTEKAKEKVDDVKNKVDSLRTN